MQSSSARPSVAGHAYVMGPLEREEFEREVSGLPGPIGGMVRRFQLSDGGMVAVMLPRDEKGMTAIERAGEETLRISSVEMQAHWFGFSPGGLGHPARLLQSSLPVLPGTRALLDHEGTPCGPDLLSEMDPVRGEVLLLVTGNVDVMKGRVRFDAEVACPGRVGAIPALREQAGALRRDFWHDPSGSILRSMVLIGIAPGGVRVLDALWLSAETP